MARFDPPDAQCSATNPEPPWQGEHCVLMPHPHWMPHSWIPWSRAVEMQAEQRTECERLGADCPGCVASRDTTRTGE